MLSHHCISPLRTYLGSPSRIVFISPYKTWIAWIATASHTILGDYWLERFKFSAACLVNLLRQLVFPRIQTPALPTPWFSSIKRLNLTCMGPRLCTSNTPFKHWGLLFFLSRGLYTPSWIGSNIRWFKNDYSYSLNWHLRIATLLLRRFIGSRRRRCGDPTDNWDAGGALHWLVRCNCLSSQWIAGPTFEGEFYSLEQKVSYYFFVRESTHILDILPSRSFNPNFLFWSCSALQWGHVGLDNHPHPILLQTQLMIDRPPPILMREVQLYIHGESRHLLTTLVSNISWASWYC